MNIEICFSPALFQYYNTENSIVVIVDIFRATTSICTAFQNGLKSVKTVSTIEEAQEWKQKGFLVAAERNVKKVDFADFGNSPFEFTSEKVKGKELIFTTTNGTQAVEAAKKTDEIIIGAFSNIDAISIYCTNSDKNIFILCSGWNNKFCTEDSLFAGAMVEKLLKTGKYNFISDAVFTSLKLWEISKNDLSLIVKSSEHYKRLENNKLTNSVDFCLTKNTTNFVPKYNKISNCFYI